MVEIKGFIRLSLVDWDGMVSSVLFVPYCNFRCPFCYNSSLVLYPERIESIPLERIEAYLMKYKGWIDGVCITGGEPMLHKDLPDLCGKLKGWGFPIKVDTNGTNPLMMKKMIERELVDYIAVDIKAPLREEKYSSAVGIGAGKLVESVKESIRILLESNTDYEFRTTLVPTVHGSEDVREICDSIRDCRKYVLQKFATRNGKNLIDPDFSKLKSFTDDEMEAFLAVAREQLLNVELR